MLTNEQFIAVFKQFDKDGNGYIAAAELDAFIAMLLRDGDGAPAPDEATVAAKRNAILDAHDADHDGRVSLAEAARLLPVVENFLAGFGSSETLTSVELLRIWYHYDNDRSGYIEGSELQGFLLDLVRSKSAGVEISTDLIDEYAATLLEIFDRDGNGKLQLDELSEILPVESNFLRAFVSDGSLSADQFNQVFAHYDQDGDGEIAAAELQGLVRDLMELQGKSVSIEELEAFKQQILASGDGDHSGSLSRDELVKLF